MSQPRLHAARPPVPMRRFYQHPSQSSSSSGHRSSSQPVSRSSSPSPSPSPSPRSQRRSPTPPALHLTSDAYDSFAATLSSLTSITATQETLVFKEIRRAIDAKEDINEPNPADGNTLVMIAVQAHDLPSVLLLLQHGADVFAVNDTGKTVYDLACVQPIHHTIKQHILRACISQDPLRHQIVKIITKHREPGASAWDQVVTMLNEHQTKMNAESEPEISLNGNTSISYDPPSPTSQMSMSLNAMSLSSKSTSSTASASSSSSSSSAPQPPSSPTSTASAPPSSSPSIPKSLVHLTDGQGNQPLHYACLSGDTRVAAELLARGADLHKKNKFGQTCTMYACQTGDLAMFELLISHVTRSSTQHLEHDLQGKHVAVYAAESGNVKLVHLIGTMMHAFTSQFAIPMLGNCLSFATAAGHLDMVNYIAPIISKSSHFSLLQPYIAVAVQAAITHGHGQIAIALHKHARAQIPIAACQKLGIPEFCSRPNYAF